MRISAYISYGYQRPRCAEASLAGEDVGVVNRCPKQEGLVQVSSQASQKRSGRRYKMEFASLRVRNEVDDVALQTDMRALLGHGLTMLTKGFVNTEKVW